MTEYRGAERRSERLFRGCRYCKTLQFREVVPCCRGEPRVSLNALNKRRTTSRARTPSSRSVQSSSTTAAGAPVDTGHAPRTVPSFDPNSGSCPAAARARCLRLE